MTGEEAAEENKLQVGKIATSLITMDNNFQFIEGVVDSWIWFSKEGHPSTLSEREQCILKFCAFLDQTEERLQFKLSYRDKFETCLRSDLESDWRRVIMFILPMIRSEILSVLCKGLYGLSALPNPLWSDLLPNTFADQVLPLFRAKQYLSAVRRGCDVLRATIRKKTGLHSLDGVALVNQAYGKDAAFVVAVWERHSEENVQRGYMDMLRGAMSAIRNVHYHGT